MTPLVGAKTQEKLDTSDLDDPAGGVKLIKGKASFLTPPAIGKFAFGHGCVSEAAAGSPFGYTDFPAYSDTLGTREKCHCNQIVTLSRGVL